MVMIDWDRYNVDTLPVCDGKSIDAIRVVFPHGKHREGLAVGEKVKEKATSYTCRQPIPLLTVMMI